MSENKEDLTDIANLAGYDHQADADIDEALESGADFYSDNVDKDALNEDPPVGEETININLGDTQNLNDMSALQSGDDEGDDLKIDLTMNEIKFDDVGLGEQTSMIGTTTMQMESFLKQSGKYNSGDEMAGNFDKSFEEVKSDQVQSIDPMPKEDATPETEIPGAASNQDEDNDEMLNLGDIAFDENEDEPVELEVKDTSPVVEPEIEAGPLPELTIEPEPEPAIEPIPEVKPKLEIPSSLPKKTVVKKEEYKAPAPAPTSPSFDQTKISSMPTIPDTTQELTEVISSAPSPKIEESFTEVKDFVESMVYGDVKSPGNPPFGLMVKNVKFSEDADFIVETLKEYNIIDEGLEKNYRQSLESGNLLISQLSEYAAIYLAHKFRALDCDFLMGLSHEIHPPQNYQETMRGLVTKDSFYRNRKESITFDDDFTPDDIDLTTSASIPGRDILRYIGIVSDHLAIPAKELSDDTNQEEIERYYMQLAQNLRMKAYSLRANAVVGVQYQWQQVPSPSGNIETIHLTCTGNAIIITHGNH